MNRLIRHGIGNVEGFTEGEPRGMAATSIDNDYVHRLVRMISDRDTVNVHYSVTNIAECLTAKLVTITDNSHGNIDIETLQVHPICRNMVSKGPVITGNNVWKGL